MKKTCKDSDITDAALIRAALLSCFATAKKRRRGDTRRLFAGILKCSKAEAKIHLKNRDERYMEAIDKLVVVYQQKCASENYQLEPIRQEQREDPSSHKVRTISILSINQLILDHIAVQALANLAKRIGAHQVSSITGRGATYGKKYILRWIRHTRTKYAVKLDVKDFYGSIDRRKLFAWLTKCVANRPLMHLIRTLVSNAPKGMAIGSFLSQTLANIYLSDLWHFAKESCKDSRKHSAIKHALFYMDDMLLLGTNKRSMKTAVKQLVARAKDVLGLTIKPTWHVHQVTDDSPVDMMGFRMSKNKVTLRKRVFASMRRMLLRAKRYDRKGQHYPLSFSRRIASYNGYAKDTDIKGFLMKMNAATIFKKAFRTISYYDQKKLLRKAERCAD